MQILRKPFCRKMSIFVESPFYRTFRSTRRRARWWRSARKWLVRARKRLVLAFRAVGHISLRLACLKAYSGRLTADFIVFF